MLSAARTSPSRFVCPSTTVLSSTSCPRAAFGLRRRTPRPPPSPSLASPPVLPSHVCVGVQSTSCRGGLSCRHQAKARARCLTGLYLVHRHAECWSFSFSRSSVGPFIIVPFVLVLRLAVAVFDFAVIDIPVAVSADNCHLSSLFRLDLAPMLNACALLSRSFVAAVGQVVGLPIRQESRSVSHLCPAWSSARSSCASSRHSRIRRAWPRCGSSRWRNCPTSSSETSSTISRPIPRRP